MHTLVTATGNFNGSHTHISIHYTLSRLWRMLAYFVIVACVCFIQYVVGMRTVVKIGGLFNPFDENGQPIFNEIQAIAAFKLAIDEINNDTSILPEYELRGIVHDVYDIPSSVNSILDYTTKVDFVISSSKTCSIEEKVLETFSITHIVLADYSGELSIGIDFPNKLRMIPSETFQGMALEDLVYSDFKYERVTTFSTPFFHHAKARQDFGDGVFGTFEFLSDHVINPSNSDFSIVIKAAKKAGAKVFILFLDAPSAVRLLEQGHKYGLFNSDTIVFGINEIWVNNPSQYLSPGADPLIIFKGCFGITANAILMLEYTPKGVEFLNKMQHLPSPLVNGVCDNSTDDEGHYYFRNNSGSCFPLDYTALDAASISPIAAVAYDAVYAIAVGLNALNTPFNSSLVARQAHYTTMINHNLVSFYGASGLVAFMDGFQSDIDPNAVVYTDYYGRGDREDGNVYSIINFNSDAYLNNINYGFVTVGHWSKESFFELCDGITDTEGVVIPCANHVTYSTADNTRPPDRPSSIYVEVSGSIVLYVSGAVFCALIIAVSVIIFMERSSSLVRVAQLAMISFMVVGEGLGAIRVILAGFNLSDAVCRAQGVIGHLSFWLVFAPLAVKLWRINRVMNVSKLSKVKVTVNDTIMYLAAILSLVSVYLAIITGIDDPHAGFVDNTVSNQLSRYSTCLHNDSTLEIPLFVTEAALVLYLLWVAYATKDLPVAFNEFYSVASCTVGIIIIAVIGLLLYYTSSDFPTMTRFSVGICFGVGVIWSTTLLVTYKPVLAMNGYHVNDKYEIKLKDPTRQSSNSGGGLTKGIIIDDETDEFLQKSIIDLRRCSNDENRFEYCITKMKTLKALLISINEGYFDGKGKSRMINVKSSSKPGSNKVVPYEDEEK